MSRIYLLGWCLGSLGAVSLAAAYPELFAELAAYHPSEVLCDETVPDEAKKFCREKLGALPLNSGDAGYEFPFLGDCRMRILVWAGDEEFPPNSQVIYTDNFAEGFAAEDRVVAGDILITTIKANM